MQLKKTIGLKGPAGLKTKTLKVDKSKLAPSHTEIVEHLIDQGDCAAEVAADPILLKELREKEASLVKAATDTEYYAVVCFETKEQRDEFMTKVGLEPLATDRAYINGFDFAYKCGVTIESPRAKWHGVRKSKRLEKLVR